MKKFNHWKEVVDRLDDDSRYYFRMETKGPEEFHKLLDPEYQFSSAPDGDETRRGISCCDSLAQLENYNETLGWIAEEGYVVVLLGEESEDEPLDRIFGEVLIYPTKIVGYMLAKDSGIFDDDE